MAVLNNSNAITTSGGYDINNSLRFRASASAYLSRTPASAGSTTLGTLSNWLKLGTISTDRMMYHVAGTSGNNNRFYITFNADNTFQIIGYNASASVVLNLNTTQVLRDPSAWYHIVVAIDTTQATSSNRAKVYINGNQVTAFSTATYPSQNQALGFTNNTSTLIGSNQGVGNLFDGYMADVNFIDGSQKAASDFGETDATTGVWKPKAYSGTYGTNGFYLKFSDIATTSGSNAGLGKDFSGNANYWTTNNISVTAGTTYDAMIDSPTLTSATVANYCTANPLDASPSGTSVLSNGNLTVNVSGSAAGGGYGGQARCNTINFTNVSGKWYWEAFIDNAGTGAATLRLTFFMDDEPVNISAQSGPWAWYWRADGVTDLTSPGTFATNDVVMFAYDSDTGKLWVGKNGTWSNSGVPSSGTGQVKTLTALAAYALGLNYNTSGGGTGTASFNFGQRPFAYTPPTGFVRLNTYNLPDSTIKKGNSYMDATLYTGTGTTQSITNAGAFRPDLVWNKGRSSAVDHCLTDSNRGANKQLVSNTTGAELTNTNQVTAFNSNGFSLGADNLGYSNFSGITYVGWQWQAGAGSSTSNTSGSITSTVSVSTTAGFSIVTYTGTGANATVGHGLGVAPRMVIVKNRASATDWAVYHASVGNTGALRLNLTAATETDSRYWNNTTPTSTVFSVGSSSTVNGSSNTQVAYCWAEIAGFSKFGSYTGNGSADGPFVFTNLKPRFIIIKRTDSTSNWTILDTAREGYNVDNDPLYPNLSDAEGTTDLADILSNGFKLRSTDASVNANAGTYIYACFSSNPFKNSTAV